MKRDLRQIWAGEFFFGRDVISIEDIPRKSLDFIIGYAEKFEHDLKRFKTVLKGMTMVPLFFEPSTRTTTSFQAAMIHMGGSVIDFDVGTSSLQKGETLKDTARMIEGYIPSVVVVRHKRDGAARLVADVVSCPVINAGDGQNEHPTQTMLDLYTINQIRGWIDGVKIIIAGDLKYGRTTHSLARGLAKYNGCEVILVSPESLRFPSSLLRKVQDLGLQVKEFGLKDLPGLLGQVDILYMTRIQRERFAGGSEGDQEYDRIRQAYSLSKEMIEKAGVSSGFKVLHPLPNAGEISGCVDESKFDGYGRQAKNGLYVRMALLDLMLRKK